MANGLTMEQYVNNIKLQLGSPILQIEIEDQLAEIVNLALGDLKLYMVEVVPMTLPYAPRIDLDGLGISDISNVLRPTRDSSNNDNSNLYTYPYYTVNGGYYTSGLYGVASYALYNKTLSSLSTDMDFFHDKKNDYLYIHPYPDPPAKVTLLYTPDYKSVEEIVEPYWQGYLKRLSVAYAKVSLGRIRDKYNLNSAIYNLDGDRLLNEGTSELDRIHNHLSANINVLMPMD